MPVFYRSFDEANRDIARWEPHIPEISAVAGVPRSGVAMAAMLALIRHIPLVPIEALTGHAGATYRPALSRRLKRTSGPVLLLDDTVWRGRVKGELRSKLRRKDVLLGALYASDRAIKNNLVDLHGYRLGHHHHTFAWNIFRDMIAPAIATDLDGVLAEDYHGPDERQHPEVYIEWMRKTRLLLKPRYPIQSIVTARVEAYRTETEVWLRRNGIQYSELHMRPNYDVPVVPFKVQKFRQLKMKVCCFVESEDWIAKAMAKKTKWSVISWKNQITYNGRLPIPSFK